MYSHLSSFKASLGDIVKQGQVIALSGNTGESTGPHLDFMISTTSTYSGSTKVNPFCYMPKDNNIRYASGFKMNCGVCNTDCKQFCAVD